MRNRALEDPPPPVPPASVGYTFVSQVFKYKWTSKVYPLGVCLNEEHCCQKINAVLRAPIDSGEKRHFYSCYLFYYFFTGLSFIVKSEYPWKEKILRPLIPLLAERKGSYPKRYLQFDNQNRSCFDFELRTLRQNISRTWIE